MNLFLFNSCTEEEPTASNNPVTFFAEGYDPAESAQCMTLSTLCYVNENNPAYIKDSLIVQLAIEKYATGGKWKLDWGPALNTDNSNLIYVVKDTTTNPDRYCIAVRGTDWCYYMNWKEDLWIVDFAKYPYGNIHDSISYGALLGLNQLISLRDSATNQTLVSYLNGIQAEKNKMYITGHSLGGQLATVLSAWFLDNGYSSKFDLKVYTYAAPSPGNPAFHEHYTQIFSAANAESFRVVNPSDLVPNFCATLDSVVSQQIPTTLPLEVKGVIEGLQKYFEEYNMVYENVGEEYVLGKLIPLNCNYAPGSLEQYACWVAFQHTTSTYLFWLNAPDTDYYTASCSW